MKKEEFVKLGVAEDIAVKCEAASAEELKVFIPKARFDEVNAVKKQLEDTVKDRDKQLEDLKKSTGDVDALKNQIADLQKANADQQKAHEDELSKLKLDNAVEAALLAAGAKNGKTVRVLFDESKFKLSESGEVEGLADAIKAVQKSDGYLFTEKQNQRSFKGFQPGASTTVPSSTAAGYEARLADARKNNNSLEVIKIKQEAAAEGVILM